MDIDKLKEFLGTKIDSFDKFYEGLTAVSFNGSKPYKRYDVNRPDQFTWEGHFAHSGSSYQYIKSRWWLFRERLRVYYGVNEVIPSPVLTAIGAVCKVGNLGLFVSKLNPLHVAYTPSVEHGEQDRQRHATLSSLLRMCPETWHHDDSKLAELHSLYVAYRTAKLMLLPGEFIPHVYENGPSSCMRSIADDGRSYWRPADTNYHHPTEAYNAPGFKIAVLGAEDHNKFSQRAIVWHNPHDEQDKRYTRVYGSGPLQTLLENAGYKHKSFSGAKLKAYPASRDGYYVLPYIDPVSGSTRMHACLDDAGWWHLHDGLLPYDIFGYQGQSSGVMQARVNPVSSLEWVDADGQTHSALSVEKKAIYTAEGIKCYRTVPDRHYWTKVMVRGAKDFVSVYAHIEVPKLNGYFGSAVVEDVEDLRNAGYVEHGQYWHQRADCVMTSEGWTPKSLAIAVYECPLDEGHQIRYVAKTSELKRGKYWKVSASDHDFLRKFGSIYADKDKYPKVEFRTRAGIKKVRAKNLHTDFIWLEASQRYALLREARRTVVLGVREWVEMYNSSTPQSWTEEQVNNLEIVLANSIRRCAAVGQSEETAANNVLNTLGVYMEYGQTLEEYEANTAGTNPPEFVQAARRVRAALRKHQEREAIKEQERLAAQAAYAQMIEQTVSGEQVQPTPVEVSNV